MPLQAKLNFGNMQVTINGRDELELFKSVSIFTEMPCACGKCESKNIGAAFRTAKGYDFYYLKCREANCGAMFDLGQTKEDHRLFPKADPDDRTNHVGGWYFHEEQDFSRSGGGGRDDDRDRGRDRDDRRGDDRGRQGGGNREREREPAPRDRAPAGGRRRDEEDDIPF